MISSRRCRSRSFRISILSAIEILSGKITDVQQITISTLDYARLESRVAALEKQMEKIGH